VVVAPEVAEAVSAGPPAKLADELGDLLFQTAFLSQLLAEDGAADWAAVAEGIHAKLVRRHPHVFGQAVAETAGDVRATWESVKTGQEGRSGIFHDVPAVLPSPLYARKVQRRAGAVGFDWNDPHAVIAKIREELDEFEHELSRHSAARDAVEDELGDILFAVANLGRHLGVDPEKALRRSNAKFLRRFRHIEAELEARGTEPRKASLEEMEAIWTEAKRLDPKA
jgi:ATP diphosphatase